MRWTSTAASFALLLWCEMSIGQTARPRLVVIVSPAQTITDITLADLRAIYLGEITRWPTRHRIVPVVLTPQSVEGQQFIRRVVGMAELDYGQHWIGMVFRGQAASAPLVAPSSEAAKRFVASHPDAIAVIGAIPIDKTVRTLSVDGKTPDASDYPLAF
jgi:ABC-type phosphate transport system substrate-binding protein